MTLNREHLSLAKYQLLVLSSIPMNSLELSIPALTYLNSFPLYQSVFIPSWKNLDKIRFQYEMHKVLSS
jgi:hypothetical protein